MAKPKNKSYFPLRRPTPTAQKLTRKQISALKRSLAKHGRKLPKLGYCSVTTKIGGKFSNVVGSMEHSTSEVCHERLYGKHVYTLNARPARSRGRY